MSTRRRFLGAMAGLAVSATGSTGCTSDRTPKNYAQAVHDTWRHGDGMTRNARALQLELVRYATLAASSHNTQCWKFQLQDRLISILPDFSRRCPAVDPDDHHLFVSLGCAAENLVQAARAHGRHATASFQAGPVGTVQIALKSAVAEKTPLFQAIPERQSTRAEYDGKPLSADVLKQLASVATGAGIEMLTFTERPALEQILEYVVQGNTAQMADPAFVNELKAWIRFSESEAAETGDGLFAGSSGNPTAPRWLGERLLDFFFNAGDENDKYARHIRSSAGIAVFVSEKNDKAHWMEAGRSYQRFALQAAALGIRTAFLNQPVEVPVLRQQFASYLGIGDRRPDLVLRFGHGPQTPRSLRRPVSAVIV